MKTRMKMMIFFLMLILSCVSGTRSVEAKSKGYKAGKTTYSKLSKSRVKKKIKKNNKKSRKNKTTFKTTRASDKSSELKVHFIDVGEGDAILLTFGKEAMMIDYGTKDTAAKTYKYVKSQGVSELKYAVCTHPHPDHMGGMNYFLKKMKVKKVLLSPCSSNQRYYTKAIKTIKEKKIPKEYPMPGQTYKLGKAKIKFLAPLGSYYERVNNYSLVAKVTYKKTSFLLTGDAEKESEAEMIARYGNELKSDVLKIAHHGNNKASTEEFIEKVSPKQVVISSGPNLYGNPSPNVVFRLQDFGSQVLRTDESSTLVAISTGKKIKWK